MADDELPARQEFEFSMTTVDRGKTTIRMVDRINIDDIVLHMIRREIFRVTTGSDEGDDINQLFKDFLLKERFTAGQN